MLHLPVIVEAAESSPQAAAAAAYQIRKFLSKDHKSRVQYNAIMLIRILADNPGPSFTRNIDSKFVSAVKEVVKNGRDPSVQQMMRETLDALEAEKSHDNGLYDLLAMWRHVKGHNARIAPQGGFRGTPPPMPRHPNTQLPPNSLPTPQELASRVEEARNTAKILLQLLQSTPSETVMDSELIKEFSERCQTAQRSMQEYINCDSPPPDDDTLQTLIETNEQLSLALSRHQRAVLQARRALGVAARNTPSPAINSAYAPPPPTQLQQPLRPTPASIPSDQSSPYSPVSPIHSTTTSDFSAPPGPPPGHFQNTSAPNPFADPVDDRHNHDLDYTDHHSNEPRNYGPFSTGGGGAAHTQTDAANRPAYGNVTDSYMGRQYSAVNGLTMHGANDMPDVSPVEPPREVRYRY